MKKTVTLLLVAMMVLMSVSALALVGSHPTEGDKDGVRKAIINASIGKGGEMLDQPAIDALGLKFTAAGLNTNGVGKYWLVILLNGYDSITYGSKPPWVGWNWD